MKLFSLLFCLIVLAVACSPEGDAVPKVAGDQRKVLDKAKAIDATVQESTAAEKQKIDAQSE